VAAIIGAFLGGMVVAERSDQGALLAKAEVLVNLFLPFFLVDIGMRVQVGDFAQPGVLVAAVIVTLLAVAGKYWGGSLAARGLGRRTARQVGVGMVPRGEVGIVAAQMGLGLGALSPRLFAVVLFMAVATTLIAPPFLRRVFAPQAGEELEEAASVVEGIPFKVE
jgi:Kef-type K+ transport system membrane component KefB